MEYMPANAPGYYYLDPTSAADAPIMGTVAP
jgi:hypothetical protein